MSGAPLDPALRAELAALYARVDAETAARAPRCDLSGRCCDFPRSEHRLYATEIESAYALAAAGGTAPAAPSGLCPWHVDGLCRNRDGRPLGCRLYFCDPDYQAEMPDRYERHHAELRAMHERHGVAYAYGLFVQAVARALVLLVAAAPALAAAPAAPRGQREPAPVPAPAAPASPAGLAPAAGDEVNELNERARVALEEGKPGTAVTLLEKACALDPAQATLRKNLAWAYFRRGQQQAESAVFHAAAADYRKAAELNPDEAGYRIHLGQLLIRSYQLPEAERVLGEVVRGEPEAGDAWLLLGDALSLQDELPAAIEAYDEASGAPQADVAALARQAAERTRRQHAVEKDYRTDETQFFVIRGPARADGPLFGVRLTGVLERARAEVVGQLRHFPQQKTIVVLYPQDVFAQATGMHEWVGGLFDRKIRLPIVDVERDEAQIEAAFRHEFTHLIVSELAPRCPTFVNEGVAQLMEYGRGNGMPRLVAYLDAGPGGRDRLPRLADLPETFLEIGDRDAVNLAYLVSYAFVDNIVSRHGIKPVVDWVIALETKPLAEAFEAATGRALSREETAFRERVAAGR